MPKLILVLCFMEKFMGPNRNVIVILNYYKKDYAIRFGHGRAMRKINSRSKNIIKLNNNNNNMANGFVLIS